MVWTPFQKGYNTELTPFELTHCMIGKNFKFIDIFQGFYKLTKLNQVFVKSLSNQVPKHGESRLELVYQTDIEQIPKYFY